MRTMAANLGRAWRVERDDPAGVLLPAAGLLMLQVLAAMAAQRGWGVGGWQGVVVVLAAATAVRVVVGAPLRAWMLVAAARSMGIAARARWMALLGVQLLVGPLQVLLAGACLAAGGVIAGIVAGHGWYTTAGLLGFLGLVAATLVTLVVRTLFAYAPVEVVAAGRSGTGALWASLQRTPADALAILLLLGIGDLLTALGALACGAGALPGYPISDLALLDRWKDRDR